MGEHHFDTTNAPAMLRAVFGEVEVHAYGGEIVLRDAGPAVRHAATGRDDALAEHPDLDWDAAMTELEAEIERGIASAGSWRTHSRGAVYLCHRSS